MHKSLILVSLCVLDVTSAAIAGRTRHLVIRSSPQGHQEQGSEDGSTDSTGSISPINVSRAFPPSANTPGRSSRFVEVFDATPDVSPQPSTPTLESTVRPQLASLPQQDGWPATDDEEPVDRLLQANAPPVAGTQARPPSPATPPPENARLGIEPQCFKETQMPSKAPPGSKPRNYDLEKECSEQGKCHCKHLNKFSCDNSAYYVKCSAHCQCNAAVPTYLPKPPASEKQIEKGPSKPPSYTSEQSAQSAKTDQAASSLPSATNPAVALSDPPPSPPSDLPPRPAPNQAASSSGNPPAPPAAPAAAAPAPPAQVQSAPQGPPAPLPHPQNTGASSMTQQPPAAASSSGQNRQDCERQANADPDRRSRNRKLSRCRQQ